MAIDPSAPLPSADKTDLLPAVDQALIGLTGVENPSVRVDAFNCSSGPKDDGMEYERGYGYTVRMIFDNAQSRDKFMERPTLHEDANTIRQTSESMLQETFNLEGERDGDDYYASENTNEDTMINTLTSGTQGDIEAIEPELGAILKSTFPDSGIVGIKIEDVKGIDSMCYPSYGEPYADNAPVAEQTTVFNHAGPNPQRPGF